MQALRIRKIDFHFDDDIPFQFNPANPHWSNFANFISMIAPGFERYFIKAIRQSMDQIKNPAVKREADWFCMQEGQHAKQHLAHANMLVHRYPKLQATLDAVSASYDQLFASESTAFHLSYAATVELAFGPSAKFMINNRQVLFGQGDSRISSFILWHLVEEFEHRNAAYDVYNDIVGSYWYRLKTAPKVFKHLMEIEKIVRAGLTEAVPVGDYIDSPCDVKNCFDDVPLRQKLSYLYDIVCTFLPYHNPDNIEQPPWVTRWFNDEEAGVDMRRYYPDISP